jgi:hypothetical protein
MKRGMAAEEEGDPEEEEKKGLSKEMGAVF